MSENMRKLSENCLLMWEIVRKYEKINCLQISYLAWIDNYSLPGFLQNWFEPYLTDGDDVYAEAVLVVVVVGVHVVADQPFTVLRPKCYQNFSPWYFFLLEILHYLENQVWLSRVTDDQ